MNNAEIKNLIYSNLDMLFEKLENINRDLKKSRETRRKQKEVSGI